MDDGNANVGIALAGEMKLTAVMLVEMTVIVVMMSRMFSHIVWEM
jgi:hypothetical protein